MENVNSRKLIPTAENQKTSVESRNTLENTGKKNRYRQAIFDFIQGRGKYGATCDEVEKDMELRHQTASCFIRFLTKDGILIDSGEKRQTRANRRAIVWIDKKFAATNTKQMELFR